MIKYEKATREAVWDIACRLREQDKQELWLATGNVPKFACFDSFLTSKYTWTASVNGTPEAVFGVTDGAEGMGVVWMLGTDMVVKHQRALVVDAKQTVDQFLTRYPLGLYNFVHAENTRSIRWLRYLGFQFRDPIPFGPFGATFFPFVRYNNV